MEKNITKIKIVLSVLLISCFSCSIFAQDQALQAENLIYIDSLKAGPGQDIVVKFNLRNSVPLNALSIPITYDPNVLRIKEISFAGSRGEFLSSKLYSPLDINDINGHFQVGFVRIFEDPIPAGEGLAFTATFTVSDSATGRFVTKLDSLFYPPGGELIFAEADFSSTIIYPQFIAGLVYVDASNVAPTFAEIPSQLVQEGDTIKIEVNVTDQNSDNVTITCVQKPEFAVFVDNGDGTGMFVWVPPYLGDESSDGPPITVAFITSDGDLSDSIVTEITVVNTNRKPQISTDALVSINAGETVVLEVYADEPDLETISWEFEGLPFELTQIDNNNVQFIWSASVVDTGQFFVSLIASDPHGLKDTAKTNIKVLPVDLYTVSFDTVSAFPNGNINVGLNLENKLPVSAFSLLIKYDQFDLTFLDITNTGTRTTDFEYFSYTNNADEIAGNLRITGIMNINSSSQTLSVGSGLLANIQFKILSDLSIGGNFSPLTFVVDSTTNDNNLQDSTGALVVAGAVIYQPGYVDIISLNDIDRGDINLNGISYEIGDAIYFAGFFMNPVDFPLNTMQLANSDVNDDNIVGSVADLVALINVMLNGGQSGKLETMADPKASIFFEEKENSVLFYYDTDFEIGGIFLSFNFDKDNPEYKITNLFNDLEFMHAANNSTLNVLQFSYDGKTMPVGRHPFIEIETTEQFDIERGEFATSFGSLVSGEINDKEEALPLSFALYQNYPNPFNPETNISFDLDKDKAVKLSIFNVLGQEVKLLINERVSSGSHTVRWDGTDNENYKVASGVYFYRLSAGKESLTRKMMLLK